MQKITTQIPDVQYFADKTSLSASLAERKIGFDKLIQHNNLSRKKLTVVCGPCAADDVSAVAEYVRGLKDLADKYDNLLVVARVYTAKPHSDGTGYGGMLFGDDSIVRGIADCRKMMVDCLNIGLPVADEILYPDMFKYFADLVSYAFIGARSSEDALHRAVASSLDIGCGVKNGTDGDIKKAVDSLNAVANPCVYPLSGNLLQTSGNKSAHIVLRGGVVDGVFATNIDNRSLSKAKKLLSARGLNDFVMVDLSHANSGKVAVNQIANALSVASNPLVDGVMVESYLHDGKGGGYGISRTDDCLGLAKTDEVLRILSDGFSKRS